MLTKKRADLKHKVLRTFGDRASTEEVVGDGVSFEFSLGKILLPKLEAELKERGHVFDTLAAVSENIPAEGLPNFDL